jgi:hypothetical protein
MIAPDSCSSGELHTIKEKRKELKPKPTLHTKTIIRGFSDMMMGRWKVITEIKVRFLSAHRSMWGPERLRDADE